MLDSYFRMLDASPTGVFPIALSDAKHWNSKGYGIFWSLNSFRGARRIENLASIDSWAIDIDAGDKELQWRRIEKAPLFPSLIVETKRGFQVYFFAKDAKPNHWNSLVLDRLVPYYQADKNARDLARIMRVPGYLHLKNPADPFRVREIFRSNATYSEAQIVRYYQDLNQGTRNEQAHEAAKREVQRIDGGNLIGQLGSFDFWDRLWASNHADILARFSGTSAVGGEVYSFKSNRSGTQNILVDGKSSSCWVDRNGRIGSLSSGGPTIYQWLRWFGLSPKHSIEAIKHTLPELDRD